MKKKTPFFGLIFKIFYQQKMFFMFPILIIYGGECSKYNQPSLSVQKLYDQISVSMEKPGL